MTKILVTGSEGQLGKSIQSIVDSHKNIEFIFTDLKELDICDEGRVIRFLSEEKPDFLINCAGYTAVDHAEADARACFLLNSTAPGMLGKICQEFEIKFIHLSTDYVFSGNSSQPYREEDETHPSTVYGASKLEGEKRLEGLSNSLIIRTSWLYSAYGKNFFKTILRLCQEEEEIGVVFDQIGSPTYAPDLAEAILQVIELSIAKPSAFKGGVYHFSGEGVCSWYDFAWMINKYSGNKSKILPVKTSAYPTPAKRPAYSVLDKSKIKEEFKVKTGNWIEGLWKALKLEE